MKRNTSQFNTRPGEQLAADDRWVLEMNELAAQMPKEDWDELERILAENERLSKLEAARWVPPIIEER